MPDIYVLLIIGHIIGTILGVGAATYIEVHLNMALADGSMDPKERAFLGKDFLISRIGLGLCLLTGLGFVALYLDKGQYMRLYDGVFLAKMLIIVILIGNAILLHKHKIGLYWGSAFSFVSWWSAMLLGIFSTNNVKIVPGNNILAFIVVMGVYAVLALGGAFILHRIRSLTKSATSTPAAPTPNPPQQA